MSHQTKRRNREEHHGVQHVIPERVAEDLHRDERERAETLRDVVRGRVASEQPPVPADDAPSLQQPDAVDGRLVERRVVVFEWDLRPSRNRKPREQRRHQDGGAGDEQRQRRCAPNPYRLADLPARRHDQHRCREQRRRVPRLPPAVERARQRGPLPGEQEVQPRQHQRNGERSERRPSGQCLARTVSTGSGSWVDRQVSDNLQV